MKKILLLLFMLCSIGVRAQVSLPTNDHVYATELKYNTTRGLYYFDVVLKGEELYCGYGMDIYTSNGIEINKNADGSPNITRLTAILPYTIEYDEEDNEVKKYSHEIMPGFPDGNVCHARVACLPTKGLDFIKTEGNIFRVFVNRNYSTGVWPIGSITFKNVELNKIGQSFEAPNTETIILVHTGETTLPLNVSSAAKWSTCILPFAAEIPEGVIAYTCSSADEENVYLDKAESIEAFTPYILYAENGYTGEVTGTVSTCPESGVAVAGYLNGAIVPQTVSEGYVLQMQGEDVKFYAILQGDSFAITAGKCWMTIPDGNSNVIGFKTDDEAAGINSITIPISSVTYDLHGRPDAGNRHGVIIKNGKKIICL